MIRTVTLSVTLSNVCRSIRAQRLT